MTDDLPTLRLLGGEPDDESELPRYEPGATVPAILRFEAGRTTTCRAVYATARWRAEGGGAVDGGTAPQICVSSTPIEPGPSVELPFDYPLPFHPWTYAGELIEITWELEVRLDTPLAADRSASAGFVLGPTASGRRRAGAATTKRGE